MKDSLHPGLEHRLTFQVPASKTVPALYPESAEFQQMPEVFATGFLVGLLEWACIQLVNPTWTGRPSRPSARTSTSATPPPPHPACTSS